MVFITITDVKEKKNLRNNNEVRQKEAEKQIKVKGVIR